MQRSDQIKVLLSHLAIIFLGQILLILLIQFTMQFIILQDRLPRESLESKSFDEITKMQKEIAEGFEKELTENPEAINERYYEIVFQERNGILFWSSLMWAVSFILPGLYFLGKKMNVPISKLEDPIQFNHLKIGILGGLGIFFAVSMIGILLHIIDLKPKNNEFQILLFKSLKSNTTLLAWSLYSVGLVTGILEEWFFRGMILKHYISKGMMKEGWILSSVLFGALHYSPDASLIIPILLSGVGIMFGYLYIRYSSIWVPISAHATYNSVIVFLAYFFGDKIA